MQSFDRNAVGAVPASKKYITLKKSNCKNCYKCIRHCPVKSIRFSGNQAHIIDDDCILCGNCFVVCPQNAKQISDETEKVKFLLQSGKPVVASIAPSFVANYDGIGIEAMRNALKKLGFCDAEETAVGAEIVKREYQEILKKNEQDIIITSCCHSVNLLVQKYFPTLSDKLADVLSPMQAHCLDIKRRMPDASVVFISPCVAKKDEAQRYSGFADAVLTFEQLSEWFSQKDIEIEKLCDNTEKSRTRLFPTSGGILKSMDISEGDYTYMVVDGVEDCIETLREIETGKLHKCFIEMSACRGSCINGPAMERKSNSINTAQVIRYAGNEDFEVNQPEHTVLNKKFNYIDRNHTVPPESEISVILRQMGKMKPEDELNCGSCGYNTCREKAVAIYQGKAEISMCLPFLKEKAESFSDTIVKNTPNGIIVLNEALEVQQINRAARKIMNIRNDYDVLGQPVVRIMDPQLFFDVLHGKRSIPDEKIYLPEYDKYVEQTIVYDKEYHLLIGIMRDVTSEENQRELKERIGRQTVETADRVVEKQMRIVQEIALLLGETAAETKIALTKLKESIGDE